MEIKLNDVEAYVDADELANEVVETDAFTEAVERMLPDTDEFVDADDVERIVDRLMPEMPDVPDMDDYVTHSGLDGHIEGEAAALLRSMPDDPERRCPLGQAFTRAVEQVVLNSDSVQALIEVFVTDALDAKAQTALDVEWAAIVAALPVSGVAS